MPYSTENVPDSETAYKVFREIAIKDKGDYGKNIAEKLDIQQQQASGIIDKLKDLGLVERGVRTKAQFYHLNASGLQEFFINEIDCEVERNLSLFLSEYVKQYCKDVKRSTIRRMLFREFFEGIERLDIYNKPEWMEQLISKNCSCHSPRNIIKSVIYEVGGKS